MVLRSDIGDGRFRDQAAEHRDEPGQSYDKCPGMGRRETDHQSQRLYDARRHCRYRLSSFRDIKLPVRNLLHHVPFVTDFLPYHVDDSRSGLLVIPIGLQQPRIVEDGLFFIVLEVMDEYGEGEENGKELREQYLELDEKGNPERSGVGVECQLVPHIRVAVLHSSYVEDSLFPVVVIPRRQEPIQPFGDNFRRPKRPEEDRGFFRVRD